MIQYKTFDIKDRKTIEALIKTGVDFVGIAKAMNRSRSGIKQELFKNGGYLEYNAETAQKEADSRRKCADGKRALTARKRSGYYRNPYSDTPIVTDNAVLADVEAIKGENEAANELPTLLLKFRDHLQEASKVIEKIHSLHH